MFLTPMIMSLIVIWQAVKRCHLRSLSHVKRDIARWQLYANRCRWFWFIATGDDCGGR